MPASKMKGRLSPPAKPLTIASYLRCHRRRSNSSRKRRVSLADYHSFDMSYPSSSQCGQSNESYMYWSTGLSGLRFSYSSSFV